MGRLPGNKGQLSSEAAALFVLLTSFAVMLLTSGFFLDFLTLPNGRSSVNTSYPKLIPWISEKGRCEKTSRIWQNDKCWDNKNHPSFGW